MNEKEFEYQYNDMEFQDALPTADPVRRVMNLYYLVDVSGSMDIDGRMSSVNQVMPDIIKEIEKISIDNNDAAEIKVSCLKFGTGAEWMYDRPLSPDNFKWITCEANGMTDLGYACKELEKHLHRDQDLASTSGHFAPAIILLSDGGPTDNFEAGMQKLESNQWFNHAIKIAIAIGTSTDNAVLVRFVGPNAGKEAVLQVTDIAQLKELIRMVSCAVSRIGSSNGSIGTKSKTEELNEVINDGIKELNEDAHGTEDSVLDIKPLGDDIFK